MFPLALRSKKQSLALLFPSDFDSFDIRQKSEFRRAFLGMVVPDHDFVRGVLGVFASSHQRNQIGFVVHLDDPNATPEI